MLNTFDLIVILCGLAGMVMVVGSLLLLYQGVIKLSDKAAGTALEAEFRNQLRVNIRNPALGLFAIGFFFFALALYFGRRGEEQPLVISAHIKVADTQGMLVKLQAEESRIPISSEGEIHATIQPLEKLLLVVEAPNCQPRIWVHPIRSDEARNGRIEVHFPEFTRPLGTLLSEPKSENPRRPLP